MNQFYESLIEILKQNKKFVSDENTLLKNKIYESAMRLDEDLLRLLFEKEEIRDKFFKKIGEHYVFDKVEFGWLLNNREFLPDSYTKFKNKIGLITDNDTFISSSKNVVLSFPFKDCILEFDSTDENENRDEIFYNESIAGDTIERLLAPKVLTNVRRYTTDGVERNIVFNEEDNLIIKGNNLISLSSLLPRYRNKIKCMYWDILYNTNNDLVPYNDSFKHSSWLTMMKNRLEIAKKLLDKDNGVIVIECDKNEDAYLKVLMDEIFGRNNFVNSIALQSSTPSGTKLSHRDSVILKTKDTLLVYKMGSYFSLVPQYIPTDNLTNFNYYLEKDKDSNYVIRSLSDVLLEKKIIKNKKEMSTLKLSMNPKFEKFVLKHKRHIFRKQPSMPEDMKKLSKSDPNKIFEYKDSDGNKYLCQNGYRFAFIDASIRVINGEEKVTQLLCDIWTDISFHGTQYEGFVDLPAGKKPEKLIQRILEMFTKPGDLVLDAYFGTGTTGAVAMKMNRRFIGLEQLENHCEKAVTRLKDVIAGDASGISKDVGFSGGGSFVYCELKNLDNQYMMNIAACKDTKELMKIYEELIHSPFVSFRVDIKAFNDSKKEFVDLTISEQKKILMAILDKNQLYVNYSDIEDQSYSISDEDKQFNAHFYKGD